MPSHSNDPDRCPVCSHEYAQKVVIERGTSWRDLYPGSAFNYVKRYRRRCTATEDVEADTAVGRSKRVLYFHDDQR